MPFDDAGLFRIVSRGKHGYMDICGRAISSPQSDEAMPIFSCGLADAMAGDRWGYIYTSGDWVILGALRMQPASVARVWPL